MCGRCKDAQDSVFVFKEHLYSTPGTCCVPGSGLHAGDTRSTKVDSALITWDLRTNGQGNM